MAPSATITETETAAPPKVLQIPRLFGAYKELATANYYKEAEQGKTGLKAAKVR